MYLLLGGQKLIIIIREAILTVSAHSHRADAKSKPSGISPEHLPRKTKDRTRKDYRTMLLIAYVHPVCKYTIFILFIQETKRKQKETACLRRLLIFSLIEALILVFTCSFGLFTTLDAGALIVLFLSQISQNAGLCTASLKSFKSVVQRLVFLDVNFRHLFPSLQTRHAGA